MKTEDLETPSDVPEHRRSLRGCLESYVRRSVSEEEWAQACEREQKEYEHAQAQELEANPKV